MKRKSSFTSLNSVVEEIIEKLRPPDDSLFDNIKENWEKIVGTEIAKNTKLERLEENTLFVKVNSHIWKNELRGGLGNIIFKKIQNEVTDKIKKIHWQ